MERRKHRRSSENKISGIYVAKETRSGETYERKNAKKNDSDKKNMEI